MGNGLQVQKAEIPTEADILALSEDEKQLFEDSTEVKTEEKSTGEKETTETAPEKESVEEEKQTETKESENGEEEKENVSDLLSKTLGLQEVEEEEVKSEPEKLKDENKELKTKLLITQQTIEVQNLLSKMPEKEAKILMEILPKLASKNRLSLTSKTTAKEWAANLLAMARGISFDKIRALDKEVVESKKEYDGILSDDKKKANKKSNDEMMSELIKKANAGDSEAKNKLFELDSQEIDEVFKDI